MGRRKRTLLVVAAIIVAIGGTAVVWHVVVEARWRSYVANDLPAYRNSHWGRVNAGAYQYKAVPIPVTERKCKDPVWHQTRRIVQYGVVPGPDTQARIDEVNAQLATGTRDIGQLFADDALGRSEHPVAFAHFFGGDEESIATYRAKLDDFDGVERKLELKYLISDPMLAAILAAYT